MQLVIKTVILIVFVTTILLLLFGIIRYSIYLIKSDNTKKQFSEVIKFMSLFKISDSFTLLKILVAVIIIFVFIIIFIFV